MSGYAVGQHATPGVLIVEGSFEANGAGAPINVRGGGFSVGAPSTGAHTLTLPAHLRGTRVVALFASTESDAAGATHRAFFRSGSATTGAFVVQTQSAAGTAANLTGVRVNVRLVLGTQAEER